jgi:hypothetical protein
MPWSHRGACTLRSAKASKVTCVVKCWGFGGHVRCEALWLQQSCALRGAVTPAVPCAARCWSPPVGQRVMVARPTSRVRGSRRFGFAQTRYVLPCGIVFRGCTSVPRGHISQNVYVVSHSPEVTAGSGAVRYWGYGGLERCEALKGPCGSVCHGRMTGESRARLASLGFA